MIPSSLVICPLAFDSNGGAHLGFGAHPDFENYIESVFPKESVNSSDKWNDFVIRTDFSGIVKAMPEVTLSSGETVPFSYWLVEPENAILTLHCREMMFFKGQHGVVGMYYGIKKDFKPGSWPKLNHQEFEVWVRNLGNYNHNFLIPEEPLLSV